MDLAKLFYILERSEESKQPRTHHGLIRLGKFREKKRRIKNEREKNSRSKSYHDELGDVSNPEPSLHPSKFSFTIYELRTGAEDEKKSNRKPTGGL